MIKKGRPLGSKIGTGRQDSGGPYSNRNLVRIGYVPVDIYKRFIKLAHPDESIPMLLDRLSSEYRAPKETPKTICGIRLRKRRRHN